MKAAGQKLKKLKTKKVYGFKKDHFNGRGNNGDPTTITTITTTLLALNNVI
jgi:hypothetical protein